MTFDEDRAAVRERLLELLLEEEFTASTDVAPARLAELAPPVSAPRPRSQRLLVAAAALLGCSAVVATAWFARGGVADAPRREGAQDPAPSAAVVVRDAEHLRTLLGSATGFRFVRREVIGVNRTVTANGFSDQLRTVAWSDDPRPIDGGVSREILRQEFGRSVGDAVAKNGVSHILDLVVDLPGGRRLGLFVNVGPNGSWFGADEVGPFVASTTLDEVLREIDRSLERRHERARGIAGSLAAVDELPPTAERIEVSVAGEKDGAAVDRLLRFANLRSVCLRGEVPAELLSRLRELPALRELELADAILDGARLAVLGTLSGLRGLTLRRCGSLDAVALRSLSTLTKLERLWCIDTRLGGEGEELVGLVALPALTEFGLRDAGTVLPAASLEPLTSTRLQRLLLVDVRVVGTDLATLADLPTLRDLTLVGRFDDADLEALADLSLLRRLVLWNCQVTERGAEVFAVQRPECELEWVLGGRYFDTARVFGESQ
ncbi:MAG: hypothetical protein KDE27_10510 [Planctomycetes bacterium]|nr:hypothetical protein [Planctomycetota bacterium]